MSDQISETTEKNGTKMTSKTKAQVWVPATGSVKTRVKKARFYLRQRAWVPDTPQEGDTAYLVVLCNLRRYHGLGAETSLTLVKECYNPRCIGVEGKPWGWSDQDILKKYRQAGGRGKYPTLGIADPKAIRKAARLELEKQIKRFYRKWIAPEGSCTPSEVREAFNEFKMGEPINAHRFGKAFSAVTGIRPVHPFGKKLYRGIHLVEPFAGFTRKK